MSLLNFLNFFGTKKAFIYLTTVFLFLVILSLALGYTYGFEPFLFQTTPIHSEFNINFHLKAITLLMYSLLGFLISLLLLLQNYIEKISQSAKLTIALLSLIPESAATFELLWNFLFWQENKLVDSFYFLFTTKLSMAIIFFFIALQIILLYNKK